jgi:hypothetical protein
VKILLRALSQSPIGSDDGVSWAGIVVLPVWANGGGGDLGVTDEGEDDVGCYGTEVEWR